MCDTIGVMSSWSKSGAALFAKNSDRSPNEPHLVIRVKEQNYTPGSQVRLTYISIPQVEHTYAAILCKPSWTWGAEMGINSESVAIGNEAVFTRAKRGSEALTGMDLVRLALERSDNARKAVDCITELLMRYGQGGNCGFDHNFYYDNSFMITDPFESYVVETSAKKWVVKKIYERQTISNRLSIHNDYIMAGGVEEGYDFAAKQTEPVYTHFSGSKQRQNLTFHSLEKPVSTSRLMEILRQHYPKDDGREFTSGSVRSTCMHAGGIVGDHTTGSMIAELRKDGPATIWCTASSTPCIATYKPVFLSVDSGAPVFCKEEDARQYWMKREMLHRGILAGKVDVIALKNKRDYLEKQWIAEEADLFKEGVPKSQDLLRLSRKAASQEQEMVEEFKPKDGYELRGHNRFERYWINKNAVLMNL